MRNIDNYIHGSLQYNAKERMPVEDPSTGEIIGSVVLSNKEDFNQTIQSSKKAFNEWSNYTPLKRSRIISKFK